MKTLALLLVPAVAFSTSLERLIDKTAPKVVKIGIVMDKGQGVCSGAFIAVDGTVLTCAHCFEHANVKKIFIKTEDEVTYSAALWAIDTKRDLALVVPNSNGPFPYLKLGTSVRRGEEVISFGSPLGIQHSVTVGYVVNLLKNTYTYVVHSAFINPGNSGGPLVNTHGELVGVNEATISYGFLQQAQGFDIAIGLETIKDFLKEH